MWQRTGGAQRHFGILVQRLPVTLLNMVGPQPGRESCSLPRLDHTGHPSTLAASMDAAGASDYTDARQTTSLAVMSLRRTLC